MFDINARLTSNYILLFCFYVRSVPFIYGTGTTGWQNTALDRTFAVLQNSGILYPFGSAHRGIKFPKTHKQSRRK